MRVALRDVVARGATGGRGLLRWRSTPQFNRGQGARWKYMRTNPTTITAVANRITAGSQISRAPNNRTKNTADSRPVIKITRMVPSDTGCAI